ncbi:hypothetical protein CMESO_410 (nucleomorph) [Chroomonas mesostigmatica CCMP1168]|uniref:Uncharacterized protein n=1 Tax=Chroomonas mesostigmatica CCMP1168 TaxID=1195612 RepID=J7G8G3_9CRYP|nr:hypothetical protein CMESO_410 [Chroomonas mesostigmatica CCMP1168]
MAYIICIRQFKIHVSSVWAMTWSILGDFLISSGGDGNILVWGPLHDSKKCFKGIRHIIEKKNFLNWNILSYTKTYYFRGTFRKIDFCVNFGQFCIGTFFGKILVCTISFSKNLKIIFIKENFILDDFTSEVKSCQFSKDGRLLSIGTRNKILWIWEKKQCANFQCLIIIQKHESDIKETTWHPRVKFLATSSYEGFLRFFRKKVSETVLYKTFSYGNSSPWTMCFNESGNQILFCSGKGEIYILSFEIPILKTKKKRISFLLFFSYSRNPLICMNLSKTNLLIVVSGQEQSLDIIKHSKMWARKKRKKVFYGSSSTTLWIEIDKSIVRSHFGNVYTCIWNPKNDKIFATSGENMCIRIWSYIPIVTFSG